MCVCVCIYVCTYLLLKGQLREIDTLSGEPHRGMRFNNSDRFFRRGENIGRRALEGCYYKIESSHGYHCSATRSVQLPGSTLESILRQAEGCKGRARDVQNRVPLRARALRGILAHGYFPLNIFRREARSHVCAAWLCACTAGYIMFAVCDHAPSPTPFSLYASQFVLTITVLLFRREVLISLCVLFLETLATLEILQNSAT